MIRVLHVAHGRVYGGIERVLATLALERDAAPGMRPEFAFSYMTRTADEIAAAGCDAHDLGRVRASRPWTVWSARRRLARLLVDRQIDVVVFHGNWAHGLLGGVARSVHIPLVAIAHAPYGNGDWTERAAGRQGASMVLANSQLTQASVWERFPGVPAHRWYCPVSRSGVADRESMRRKMGIDPQDVVVLMACRLDEYKGHEVLLGAAERLRGERRLKVWIAGGPQSEADGQRFARLRQKVEQSRIGEAVRFLGQRSDVKHLMRAADVFCQPNVGPEPFGVVFIEALWSGLPVVTSSIGGGAEIVDGSCGCLVPPGNATALAECLSWLIQNPSERARLSTGGPSRAENLCDPVRQVRELEGHLLNAMSRSLRESRSK